MTDPCIALLVDQRPAAGRGHRHRMAAIAEALARCAITVRSLPGDLAAAPPPDVCRALLADCAWLIIDDYRVDQAWLDAVKAALPQLRIAVLDDHQQRAADVRIFPWAPDDQAAGYLPLDAAFTWPAAPAAPAAAPRPRAGWACVLGSGVDGRPYHAFAEACARLGISQPVAVAGAAAMPPHPLLDDRGLLPSTTLAALLRGSSAAWLSASTIAGEAAACGTPFVATAWVTNHQVVSTWLAHWGLPVVADAAAAAQALHAGAARALPQGLVDGHGAWRILSELGCPLRADLPTLPEAPITIRCAEAQRLDDRSAVWLINAQESVRQASIDTRPIAWSTHCSWWRSARMHTLYLAEIASVAVGCARIAADGLVSIAVHPAARRRGVARELLARCCTADQPLIADIHSDNTASSQLFRAAGFQQVAPAPQPGFLRYRRQHGEERS